MDALELRGRRAARQPAMDPLQFAGGGVGQLDLAAQEVTDDPDTRSQGQPELLLDRLHIRRTPAELERIRARLTDPPGLTN